MLENCIFYISPIYEFSHSLDRHQTGSSCEFVVPFYTRIQILWCRTMRVVITGASGFIGRAALAHLHDAGIQAIGVHRQPAAAAGDVTVKNYAQSPGGDVLIHLAEIGDRSKVAQLGTRFVTEVQQRFRALLDGRYKHVIYVSSSLVYAPSDTPLRVGDRVDTTEFYAAGKLACETMAIDAGGIVMRLSNLYGLGHTGESVINVILSQMPGQGPIVIRDAEPVRDFLSVTDAAAALAMAIKLRGSEILNIGTGVGTSIGGLARILLELNGTPERAVISTQRPGSPAKFVLDIAETTLKTGWAPKVELRQGLAGLLAQG
jgi:nucleoside-diphosphate-sugar epimerase